MLRADGGTGVASRLRVLFVTYCCKEKSRAKGKIPAIERYLSPRIRAVSRRARGPKRRFRILSGKYGLLAPQTPIPWYDHLLTAREVPAMARRIARALRKDGPWSVRFVTEPLDRNPDLWPYLAALAGGAAAAGSDFCVIGHFVKSFASRENLPPPKRTIAVEAKR